MMVRETAKLKKKAFWAWLAQGSPEAADRFQEARGTADLVVTKAKTRGWEKLGRLRRRVIRLTSRKFWQIIL